MMSTNTYVALKTTTVTGSPASDITFTSIPTTYTDLMLVVTGSAASGNIGTSYIQLNGDTGTTYSTTYMAGNGSTATSSRFSSSHGIAIGGITAGIQTNQQTTTAHIMNYSNNTTNKTVLARYSNAGYETNTSVGLWQPATISTSAVTSIRIYIGYSNTTTSQDNWAVGTTATLYGIANADVGAYATGGIITQDANYYYHAFGSSSTFTPTRNLTADILVVAGGGGGSSANGGGGGAGGLLGFTSQSLTNGTGYTCTVGAGGAGGANNSNAVPGSQGSDSQFGSLTLVKGGAGAISYGGSDTTQTGGSGAGGTYRNSGSIGTGGSPTSGQGYAGGNGFNASQSSGGGGGAGTAGSTANTNGGGNGGDGTSAYNSWLSATGLGVLNSSDNLRYIAAGGGGGGFTITTLATGGKGGGGNSVAGTSSSTLAGAGLSLTGSGGGGGSYSGGSGAGGGTGGSGLIIVRYSK